MKLLSLVNKLDILGAPDKLEYKLYILVWKFLKRQTSDVTDRILNLIHGELKK